MKDYEKKRFKRNLMFCALVILFYVIIVNLRSLVQFGLSVLSLFSPLLIGIILALLLNKPTKSFERFFRFLNRKSKLKLKLSEKVITFISLTLTYILAILLLYFVGYGVAPAVTESFHNIKGSIETYYPRALSYLESFGLDTTDLRALIDKIDISEIWKTLTSNANKILDTALSTVNGVISVITNIVSAIIFSIYLLANRRNLVRQGNKLLTVYLPQKIAKKTVYVGRIIVNTFSNFITGQCLEAVILGVICFIAMSIFRFPYAVVISVIIAVTAIIPYVGALVGGAVGAVLIFMQSPMRALLFVVMFIVIQQLENHLIYPRVVGTSIGLPPIWTFAAVIIGGAVYGVVGMLIFIPMASIVYTLIKNDVAAKLSSQKNDEAAPKEDKPSEPQPNTIENG
ncbi:MAG: AI-2E family transporter [Ruminococcaceae bacterium]|nr:AI-2E family transporter [Oscillospiraceae bacterium]